MTHTILLDGKLWAFEPPEKPIEPPQYIDFKNGPDESMKRMEIGGDVFGYERKMKAYDRAYSLALEQKIEIDKDGPFVFTSKYGISVGRSLLESQLLKENEPIKWEGAVEIINACQSDVCTEDGRCEHCRDPKKLVRLIAPVKEEINAFTGKPMTDAQLIRYYKTKAEAAEWRLQQKCKPVPSEQENLANYVDLKEEQENQEEIWNEAQLCVKHELGTYSNDLVSDLARWAIEALKRNYNLTRK